MSSKRIGYRQAAGGRQSRTPKHKRPSIEMNKSKDEKRSDEKTANSQTKTKTSSGSKTTETKFTSKFKPASSPKIDQSTIRTKTTFVKQLVRETLCEYDETYVRSSKSVLENRNHRVFLGEFEFEEESECSEVLLDSNGGRTIQTKALKRFRRYAKFVMLAHRLSKSQDNMAHKLSREDTMFFYLNHLPESSPQADNPDRPLFDLTPFKSIGEKNFCLSVRSVLQVLPNERTDQQVNTMVHMLRTFAKFSSYPQRIQRGICRQGWYARFEGAKVISKQGNRAEFYYLILSGVAVSHRTSGESGRSKTARMLRRGDSLGEKEILTDTDREATIISREPIEVLGVDRDELLNIFRSAGGFDHMDFLRSIPDIQLFPLELLQAYDFSCCAHYYRRGAVIVKDSNAAEWIYIVKTGSCQVYKAIKVNDDVFDERRRRSDDMMRGTGFDDGLVLPKIHQNIPRVSDGGRSLTYDSIQLEKANPLRKYTQSSIELPSIKPGQVSMVSYENDRINEKFTETSKTRSARSRKRRSAKPRSSSDSKHSIYYAKLDIVTEKECFGLQSLIYDDMPGLSLVSNGAECILISKQFFKDNLTSTITNHLKSLVPPYPNLGKLQDALSHQVQWGSYKQKILSDTIH